VRPFTMELGPGASDTTSTEGIRHNNLLGTYMTGPILVRNPPLLKHIADIMVGRKKAKQGDKQNAYQRDGEPGAGASHNTDLFFAHQDAAYRMALTELSARIGGR